jgi:pimeloyl-ACP methyl ester carboxylesterase
MLFENPAISFNICLASLTESETVEGVWEAVETRLGCKTGVSVVGHSFGSCQVTWLLHSKDASQIHQVVLVDPVSVLLSEPGEYDTARKCAWCRIVLHLRSLTPVSLLLRRLDKLSVRTQSSPRQVQSHWSCSQRTVH